MARRRKGKGRRGKRTFNILGSLVGANAVFQAMGPVFRAGIVGAVQSGDLNAIVAAIKTGAKEAATVRNILEAVGPVLGYKALKKVASMVGIGSPRVGGVRAF